MLFQDLPLDMVKVILAKMNPTELLNSGFICKEMAELAKKNLPVTRSLRFAISHESCLEANFEGDETRIRVPFEDRESTARILSVLVPSLARAVEALHLENELIDKEVSDEKLAFILSLVKNAKLKELALSEIDLERFQMWTLALLAGFDGLEKLEIEDCRLGGDTEANLLKCLGTSFKSLTQIDLRGNPQITDTFSRRVSRSCPNLSYFRISNCRLVTTLSALPLIESTGYRIVDKLDVHMDNTEFDADQLRSFMNSPLFGSCSSEWRLEPVVVPLGYDKPAVLALHSSRKCVLIFV